MRNEGREGMMSWLIALKLLREALTTNRRGGRVKAKEGEERMISEWKKREGNKRMGEGAGKECKEPFLPPEADPAVYYDGSVRKDNQQGGAGCIFLEAGEQVGCSAISIPYGMNNVGEFTAALYRLKLVQRRGHKEIDIIGDCKILTEMMKEGRFSKIRSLEKIRTWIQEVIKSFCWIMLSHALSMVLVALTVYRYPISIQNNCQVIFNMYIYIGLVRPHPSVRRASFDEFLLQELIVFLPSPWFPHFLSPSLSF